MGNTAEGFDKDLIDGLKAAKSKRCYFALVLKGGTDGALLISKSKVAAPAIAEAKKSSGGSAVIQGFVSYIDGGYVFETAKIPPATAAQAVKTIAKRDAGMTFPATFKMSADPELAADGDGQATPANTAPTAHAGTAPTSAATTAPTSSDSAQPASTATTETGPLPETAKWTTALHDWEQASAVALSATDKLISALEATNDEVALAIASIVDQLKADFPDTLDDVLTNLAKCAKEGKAGDAESWRNKSEIAIKAALAYLNNNAQTIAGCEDNPFVAVSFRAPLTEALKKVLISVKK